MKFFAKVRDVLSKIKCNSSCFNDNSKHNETIIYVDRKDVLDLSNHGKEVYLKEINKRLRILE